MAGLINTCTIGICNIPKNANDVVLWALHLFYFVAGMAAVIVIIIAGFTYVTANGDSNSIAKAKNAILYAVIGLIVIASAFTITNFITKG